MAEEYYKLPENPQYDIGNIRKLKNSDPGNAEQILNPLVLAILEHIAAAWLRAGDAQSSADLAKAAAAAAAQAAGDSAPAEHKHTTGDITNFPSTMAPTAHKHVKSEITDFPSTMPNPNALTIQGNGTTLPNGTYDGSGQKTVNITPPAIGAAPVETVTSGDFNDMKTPGFYAMRTATANAPTSGGYHSLLVLKSDNGDYVQQIAVRESTTEVYVRYLQSDDGWSGWQMLSVDGHTHTKSQIPDFPSSMTPTSHAAGTTAYGAGSAANYGHVKLSDSESDTSGASSGIAATPLAVSKATAAAKAAQTAASGGGKVATGSYYGTGTNDIISEANARVFNIGFEAKAFFITTNGNDLSIDMSATSNTDLQTFWLMATQDTSKIYIVDRDTQGYIYKHPVHFVWGPTTVKMYAKPIEVAGAGSHLTALGCLNSSDMKYRWIALG